jgi:hypothetical protein
MRDEAALTARPYAPGGRRTTEKHRIPDLEEVDKRLSPSAARIGHVSYRT